MELEKSSQLNDNNLQNTPKLESKSPTVQREQRGDGHQGNKGRLQENRSFRDCIIRDTMLYIKNRFHVTKAMCKNDEVRRTRFRILAVATTKMQ